MNRKGKFFIIFMLIWSLIPLIWGIRTSLLSNNDLYVRPLKYFGTDMSSYRELFFGKIAVKFFMATKNSFKTSILGTISGIIITIPCAYVFSKYEFILKKTLYALIILVLAIPFYTIMIPLYRLAVDYSIIDTQIILIIIYVCGYSPMSFLIMKLYFDAVPIELEEIGMIEGASKLRRFFTAARLIAPGIVAASLIMFFNIWSSFVVPLIFSMKKTKPLTIFITEFVGKSSVNYSIMTTAGIVTLIIPIILVCVFNRYFIDGIITISK